MQEAGTLTQTYLWGAWQEGATELTTHLTGSQ
jgi:hypothetical protein